VNHSSLHDGEAAALKPRRRFRWLRWVAGVVLVVIIVAQIIYLWPKFSGAWESLREIHWGWIAACIEAMAMSMSSYGRLQQALFRAAGVRVKQRESLSVVYAATSLTLTLPAGQVFSTAFTYRQSRKWGANKVVASWQLAMSGVIATASLALLALIGALAVGASVSPFTLVLSLSGVVGLVLVGRYVSAHPDALQALGMWTLGIVNRFRRRPRTAGAARLREVIAELATVKIGRRDAAVTFFWSVMHRVSDVMCLGFACLAVGSEPRWFGVIIAFAASKAVGSVPLAPGGLGTVDLTLTIALSASAGVAGSQAVATWFVYRIVSFVLVGIVGWIVFVLKYRRGQGEDLELDREFTEKDLSFHSVDDEHPAVEPMEPGRPARRRVEHPDA
jgi:uncharacterized protein (TIRG00374 family)